MSVTVACIQCGKSESVTPTRAKTYHCCSYACRSIWRGIHWSGENNPQWQSGEREKVCKHCGDKFAFKPKSTYATFKRQKFCSKTCADQGGLRHFGPANNKWTGVPKRPRRAGHAKWAKRVISRDNAKCRRCGVMGVELQAHHIKDYLNHPELRTAIENGVTLCAPCHWLVHTIPEDNRVNCWEAPLDIKGSKGNQQPSGDRKVSEGSTTRGRSYRRVETSCSNCGKFISRRLSDAVGKTNLFCDRKCAGMFRSTHSRQ